MALSASLPAQETLHTLEPAFHIPFNFEQGDQQTDQVQLFYSTDQGDTWQLYQELPPSAGRFTFRTTDDGDYWFTVRLKGIENNRPKTPELTVSVDREKPQVELDLDREATGRVFARWKIRERHFNPESLRIEYLGDEGHWQPVPIERGASVGTEHEIKGSAEWWIAPHRSETKVRLHATDLAGNQALIERNLGGNVATPAGNAVSMQPRPTSSPLQDSSIITAQLDPSSQQTAVRSAPSAPSTQQIAAYPETQVPNWTSAHPTHVGQLPPSGFASQSGGVAHAPPTGQLRSSRSRRFNLDYELDDANGGVHRVEVWYTRDGGATWNHHGDDADSVSPYLVEVNDDGIYGFRLVVQANEGFFAKPPVSGDTPDVWVQIDSLAPSVRLTQAGFGNGQDHSTLRVVWESSDENPADHPITLLFSESVDGPWRKLVEGQPGVGMYDWRLDQSMPGRFYVKAEARDQVGNVAEHMWAEPLKTQHLHPRATIRNIRPANRSLFGAPELR